MKEIIDLSIWQMVLAYLYVLIVIGIVRFRKINREKIIVLSAVRMTLQLILVGYLLGYIIENPNPWVTILIIIIMEVFAVYTIFKKFKGRLSLDFKKCISFSMVVGTLTCLLYFLFVVVRISPWYSPQYFIPIAGMLIGNAMTGISLGVKTLLDGMVAQRQLVEEALILGATPHEACKNIINNSFDAAIIPTVNSMLGTGIIFLPGMMTGQILSGISPMIAIAYQIAIMLGIFGAVAVTIIIMLQLGYRSFFNDQMQLR